MCMILTLFEGCLRIVSRSCARSSDYVLLSESSVEHSAVKTCCKLLFSAGRFQIFKSIHGKCFF